MIQKGVHKYRFKRIEYEEQEDPDIQAEIDRHGSENVRIIEQFGKPITLRVFRFIKWDPFWVSQPDFP